MIQMTKMTELLVYFLLEHPMFPISPGEYIRYDIGVRLFTTYRCFLNYFHGLWVTVKLFFMIFTAIMIILYHNCHDLSPIFIISNHHDLKSNTFFNRPDKFNVI